MRHSALVHHLSHQPLHSHRCALLAPALRTLTAPRVLTVAMSSSASPSVRSGDGVALRVLVVGVGVSGLVSAKVFQQRGHRVSIVERASELGGVWGPSRSYTNVHLQSPRDLYAFTDWPMPSHFPEWPSGTQVHAYLDSYAKHFELSQLIRLRTEVLTAENSGLAGKDGWSVKLAVRSKDGGVEEVTEQYDVLLCCTGQFSEPLNVPVQGSSDFVSGGGSIIHSSQLRDSTQVTGKHVVVLGYGKSACDVAMEGVRARASSVTVVYRRAHWKLPHYFGGLLNFKNVLYSRVAEGMFQPWNGTTMGRMMRTLCAPLIWANWRALEWLITAQQGLTALQLRPEERFEDSVFCSLAVETDGFFQAVADGNIRMVQSDATELVATAAGQLLIADGSKLPVDMLIMATGWKQSLPYFLQTVRDAIVQPDGHWRLFRQLLCPAFPTLGFIGMNSSFATPLCAEVGAEWMARWMEGRLSERLDRASMEAGMDVTQRWKNEVRPITRTYHGLCIAPYHYAHLDELLTDMHCSTELRDPFSALLLPLHPPSYRQLLDLTRR